MADRECIDIRGRIYIDMEGRYVESNLQVDNIMASNGTLQLSNNESVDYFIESLGEALKACIKKNYLIKKLKG